MHPWAIINGGINLHGVRRRRLRHAAAAGRCRRAASCGASAATAAGPTRSCRSRRCRGRSPGRWSAARQLLRQTIGREQALVAHTRSNAYLLFQERDLGSIEAGKLADLVVLDRDYLTVPADQIKDITSVMTIVGGRVVHQIKESGVRNQ